MMRLSRIRGRRHPPIFQLLRAESTLAPEFDGPTTSPFTRRSRFWTPVVGMACPKDEDFHSLLIRAGYLRQSQSGIFHMLPLGLRVEKKLERLIDKHMAMIGASKISLSSISSQALWETTGRLEGYGPELFRFTDRKNYPYLLAPTHEEEITALVAKTVQSYKDLPLKLYQIGRKYRDEIRPRYGLLRSREFVMKDLYTFDYSVKTALRTYAEVGAAYSRLFRELKLPVLVAEASSGDIGGDLSHEYHLPTAIGDDAVVSCSSCDYVANEELATTRPLPPLSASSVNPSLDLSSAYVWRGISKDRSILVNVWCPASFSCDDVNMYAIKSVLPELDSSLNDSVSFWHSDGYKTKTSGSRMPVKLVNLVDHRFGSRFADIVMDGSNRKSLLPESSDLDTDSLTVECITSTAQGRPLNLIRIRDDDYCPRCDFGKLRIQKAIELGHTFHLGTRYSAQLEALTRLPSDLVKEKGSHRGSTMMPLEMGCYGIGLSRIVGAAADYLADERGLNWPRAIAPFEAVVIATPENEGDAATVAQTLAAGLGGRHPLIDVLLDDRHETIPWRLNDADIIGYPVVVVLGRNWVKGRVCEVQCRRLDRKEDVPVTDVPAHVTRLLAHL
ncbi:prolyl-tRNA synthetase [Durotheca rogersii]|uniref:prolyl-tRNA synthetase n=1 Tax=Durotheca rogersii TaxID=419775 RepID=UPI00221EEFEA|nr:prolyl-tRNA synthetase [Durotheca rogersii]KAI5862662.1 prolyl-tRNA synthetase [Durotheca rogersii]